VARFVGVTDCAEAEAQFYLNAAGGDFDRAVSLYFGEWEPAYVHYKLAMSNVWG